MKNNGKKHIMQKVIEELNNEIDNCNIFLRKNHDFGATHREDDPFETISFTRGKSIGLVIGRDKIKNIHPEFLTKIDWLLLRQQKDTLNKIIEERRKNPKLGYFATGDLEGILHLIDAIQDYSTDTMGMSDKEIFNLTPEEE